MLLLVQVWLLLKIFSCQGAVSPQIHAPRPNIILIIADDVSWDDIGAYGNSRIRTPNIDKLAENGLKFDNVFLAASSCSPSRISILTGRYPHNTGAAELHTPAPVHLSYFPEVLKASGYFTALAGKWHEGAHTARAYDTLLVDRKANGEGGEAQWLSLLESTPGNKPFFFWLSPYDAHRIWSEEESFSQPYSVNDVRVPETLVDDLPTRKDLASYYNEITRLDECVGILVNALEKKGQLENTVIVVMADNGRAFPGSKTRLQDRGVKTPFLVHWPAGIAKRGRSVKALVSSIDIAPTLLFLGGAKVPEMLQGRSFAGLLNSPEMPFRSYVFAEHNWHDYEAYERSVRTEKFLYIVNERPSFANDGPIDANQSPSAQSLKKGLADGTLTTAQREAYLAPRQREEFYNNEKDPLQFSNLAGDPSYQQEKERLRKVLKEWQETTGDDLPKGITKDWYDRGDGSALPEKGVRGDMPGSLKRADTISNGGPF